ncbi:MAG: hypothetical protein AVDCRST_MAG02-599 [uncultured Rubrobacteraceae bacterium]|uniref:Tetratricopeptide repeat protein n=1 Tax=uncultured Rubrobacteraceae bacterium TaxID=349277 RepID=A0A6J4QPH0_9ACTN|nr:MAG: hypothetical protein AVDCRST_MAG02-599 [uncultured Rubrobacteraceae bacterium]
MVFKRLRGIFGGQAAPTEPAPPLYGLDAAETDRIGTEDDPLRDFEAAMQRNEEAERAEQNGDPQRAVDLYEKSVAEGFVGSHPYERLASIYERRRDHAEALRVCEAFLQLAASGTMPRGAQRRADRKTPEMQARAERHRRQT